MLTSSCKVSPIDEFKLSDPLIYFGKIYDISTVSIAKKYNSSPTRR